uniref:Uncharacterized protein n=1 Tax=Knipowitschia caucasica TaxID=637954 RepID=A0AAV2M3Z7_KNICA
MGKAACVLQSFQLGSDRGISGTCPTAGKSQRHKQHSGSDNIAAPANRSRPRCANGITGDFWCTLGSDGVVVLRTCEKLSYTENGSEIKMFSN